MNKRIVIGTNSLTEAQYPAYTNHCQFWFNCGRKFPEYDFIFCNPARMSIDMMRNMAAKVAIEQNAEYLVFLDDDVIVPMDGLQKLIDTDADIAAGNVLVRGYPFDYMFFKRTRIVGEGLDPRVELFNSINEYPKIIRETEGLAAVGFSFCAIKVSLLRNVTIPYFITTRNTTEDVYFCLKAEKEVPTVTMAVDTTVECGHILWPEVLTPDSRASYTKYVEERYSPITPAAAKVLREMPKDQAEDIIQMLKGMEVKAGR